MLAVDSTVIFKSLLVNMHDFKKNSYGISLMEKSGFKRDTITILFVFLHQFQIKATQITKTYCNFSKPPSLIYQSLNFYCTFQEHLGQKVQQDWKKEKGRSWGGRHKELPPSLPHILKLPHSTTSITIRSHCIWELSCHVKIGNCKWSPRSLCVCACSCVCLEPDLVSQSICQSKQFSLRCLMQAQSDEKWQRQTDAHCYYKDFFFLVMHTDQKRTEN